LPAASDPYQPLGIVQTVAPLYPLQESQLAYGTVQVRIAVDASGQLTDSLVVASTRQWFSDSAITALKQWKFVPARRDGVAVAATTELIFNFERRGLLVVSESSGEAVVRVMREMDPGYRTYGLKELDAPPAAMHVAKPVLTEDMKSRAIAGTVVVNFYIDETGRVRMPMVSNDALSELAALVLETVRQWRFQPPTYGGRPVLTRVSQTFHFHPDMARAGM